MPKDCNVTSKHRKTNKMRRRAIFTISSASYISYAATLMQSVQQFEPDADRFIILADSNAEISGVDISAKLIQCEHMQIQNLSAMSKIYNELEFCSSLKPFSFKYLMEVLGYSEICYLDADVLVLAPLAPALEPLIEYSVVLTPHLTGPGVGRGAELSESAILRSGVYNLGFAAMRDDHDARRLLSWWAKRCTLHCRIDLAQHMFADQRWMNLAPSFVERLHVLRHPGCNVAYWNLSHRHVEADEDGCYRVNGEPLIFFHFSGIAPDDDGLLSRHEIRPCKADLGPVTELAAHYRARLHANGWQQTMALAYGFGSFADGRSIEPPMRRWLLRAVDQGRLDLSGGLDIPSDFFDKPDEMLTAYKIVLSRFMYQLWLDRLDLRAAFNIYEDNGLKSYFDWFIGGGAAAEGVDERNISIARALRGDAGLSAPSITAPPWPSLVSKIKTGVGSDTLEHLRGDVSLPVGKSALLLPRQAAVSWELRRDLQAHFDLAFPEQARTFVGWAITTAIDEGSVDPALFTDAFLAEIACRSYIASQYGDVPVSEGMLLTRDVRAHRANLARWQEFPTDRVGRLSHGLWYAFLAPRAYRWPHAMVSELLRYFAEPTDISALGFRFNRAELALWETRADVQAAFQLTDEDQRVGYLHWLVTCGLRELDLTLDEFDPRLTKFLSGPSRRFEGLSVALEMVHAVCPGAIRGLLDVETTVERSDVLDNSQHEAASIYAEYPLSSIFIEQKTTVIERIYRPTFLKKRTVKTKSKYIVD